MKTSVRMLAFVALLVPAISYAEVGVTVTVGEPGFYGQIHLGDFPQPRLLYPSPVVIRPVVGIAPRPLYLHVPPGHAKDWAKHCHKYDACGHQAYFVDSGWYNEVYVPQYRVKHGGGGKSHGNAGSGKSHGNGGHGKGKGSDGKGNKGKGNK